MGEQAQRPESRFVFSVRAELDEATGELTYPGSLEDKQARLSFEMNQLREAIKKLSTELGVDRWDDQFNPFREKIEALENEYWAINARLHGPPVDL